MLVEKIEQVRNFLVIFLLNSNHADLVLTHFCSMLSKWISRAKWKRIDTLASKTSLKIGAEVGRTDSQLRIFFSFFLVQRSEVVIFFFRLSNRSMADIRWIWFHYSPTSPLYLCKGSSLCLSLWADEIRVLRTILILIIWTKMDISLFEAENLNLSVFF